jgi:hypothetical protein
MKILKVLKEKSGVSLVILIIITALVGITAVGVTAFLSQNLALSSVEEERARALYLAEMGVADSFWELKYSEKLYSPPSQAYGQIDLQTVNFGDGTSGTYTVPEPDDSIVSIGTYRGITRRIKVGIENTTTNYALLAASAQDLTFEQDCQVVGNCFVNGSVTVTTPTNIDTLKMTLYLPSGEDATYWRGGTFPFTTVDPAPTLPNLDLTYYVTLLNLAASRPPGNVTWNSDRILPDTVLINGNLTISNNRNITTAGGSSLVVVDGQVSMGNNVSIADSIQFIAQSQINCGVGTTVGSTTGRSGNLLFSRTNQIRLRNNVIVNGSLISNQAFRIDRWAVVNGFVYVGTTTNIIRDTAINGCLWGHSFTSQSINRSAGIIWNAGYIPSPLPPGVSSIGSSSISFVENSWKEL